jgi:hypothetical protein
MSRDSLDNIFYISDKIHNNENIQSEISKHDLYNL